jgi:phage host-nuclease inhibitor protein Gam
MTDDIFLTDILTTAVEGGIDHWANARRHELGDAGYRRLEVNDHDGELEWQLLDAAVVARGVALILQDGQTVLADHWAAMLREARAAGNSRLIDAELADYIVQVGLFGEVVFN